MIEREHGGMDGEIDNLKKTWNTNIEAMNIAIASNSQKQVANQQMESSVMP